MYKFVTVKNILLTNCSFCKQVNKKQKKMHLLILFILKLFAIIPSSNSRWLPLLHMASVYFCLSHEKVLEVSR